MGYGLKYKGLRRAGVLLASSAVLFGAGTLAVGIIFASPVQPVDPVVNMVPSPLSTVTVQGVKRAEMPVSVTVIGSLVPKDEILVGVDVDGYRVATLNADVGDVVRAGQVLATLATDRIDQQLAQNAAALAQADAAISQAQSMIVAAQSQAVVTAADLLRAKQLQERGATTQQALDQALSASQASDAQLMAAKAGLVAATSAKAVIAEQRNDMMLTLSKTVVRAPCDGRILSRGSTVGAVVSGSSGPMFRIAKGGTLEMSAAVDEAALVGIQAGQIARIAPMGADETVMGVVRLVAPELSSGTHLGEVRITILNETGLRSGSFARATILLSTHTALMVPATAILANDEASLVRVVVNNEISTKEVSTGLYVGGDVEVTAGLDATDIVVVRAGAFVGDGDRVQPVQTIQTSEAKL
jgi:HlyD family secretion protein